MCTTEIHSLSNAEKTDLPQLGKVRKLNLVRLHLLQFPQLHVQNGVQTDQQEQQNDHEQRHRLVLHLRNGLSPITSTEHSRRRRDRGCCHRRRAHSRQCCRFGLHHSTNRGIEDVHGGLLNRRSCFCGVSAQHPGMMGRAKRSEIHSIRPRRRTENKTRKRKSGM